MNSLNSFSLFQGTLIIQSNQSGDILWKGKPYGIDVYQVFPIPESPDYIILLEYSSAFCKNKKNLIRLNPSGDILWEVGVPQVKKSSWT